MQYLLHMPGASCDFSGSDLLITARYLDLPSTRIQVAADKQKARDLKQVSVEDTMEDPNPKSPHRAHDQR
jgi:hypothetical protein